MTCSNDSSPLLSSSLVFDWVILLDLRMRTLCSFLSPRDGRLLFVYTLLIMTLLVNEKNSKVLS